MKQVRLGVFETNSSSTHSLVIVSESDYNKWISGALVLKDEEKLVSFEDLDIRDLRGEIEELEEQGKHVPKKLQDAYEENYHPYGSYVDKDGHFYWKNGRVERETVISKFTTPSGDNVVGISIYGSTEY